VWLLRAISWRWSAGFGAVSERGLWALNQSAMIPSGPGVHGPPGVRAGQVAVKHEEERAVAVETSLGGGQGGPLPHGAGLSRGQTAGDHREQRVGVRLGHPGVEQAFPGGRQGLGHEHREITVRGKGRKTRTVKVGHDAARALDRYIRARARHAQAHRPQLWLGINNRGPMTAGGIYQAIARRGRQCGIEAFPHRFRHHFSHTWLDRGGAEGDLTELNGRTSPQMLRRYGASARAARARRSYDRVMEDTP
jgi:hypothetical protein